MPKLYLAKTLPFLAASTVILSLLFVPLHAFANSKHSQYWYTMLRDQVLLPHARILKTFCVLRHAKQSLFMIIISYDVVELLLLCGVYHHLHDPLTSYILYK